jgi:hypothetical protein
MQGLDDKTCGFFQKLQTHFLSLNWYLEAAT